MEYCENIEAGSKEYFQHGVLMAKTENGPEHYQMGHRVLVENEEHTLCTKCCDRAKDDGATVRAA